jgi:Serine carboxypeptidase
VVADLVDAPGYKNAGYANMSTYDNIVHGQVRQAGNYAFVRIYQSGHEVPFYQPLAARALFNRVISGLDIETGTKKVGPGLRTSGPKQSTYREGIRTVQFKVIPVQATYNTTTGEPNPPY